MLANVGQTFHRARTSISRPLGQNSRRHQITLTSSNQDPEKKGRKKSSVAKLSGEDLEILSYFEMLKGRDRVDYDLEIWDPVAVNLVSGSRLLTNSRPDLLKECLLCRSPRDEISALVLQLRGILTDTTDRVLFEPSEPFFELLIERSTRHGLRVEAWLDAGNAEAGIYTWDAAGIRFHTNRANLEHFLKDIEVEFRPRLPESRQKCRAQMPARKPAPPATQIFHLLNYFRARQCAAVAPLAEI